MSSNVPITLYGAVSDSIVDGPGLRYAVFVQGCSHGCAGCHNPESQPREGGTPTTIDAVFDEISANGLVHDVTLTGGEPFEQAAACAALARRLKEHGYGIWAYTGYLYEDLERVAQESADGDGADDGDDADGGADDAGDADDAEADDDEAAGLDARAVGDLLACVDVLVDGSFVEELKSLGLTWRGSSNQRLIDVPATRAAGQIVEWSGESLEFEKPASW